MRIVEVESSCRRVLIIDSSAILCPFRVLRSERDDIRSWLRWYKVVPYLPSAMWTEVLDEVLRSAPSSSLLSPAATESRALKRETTAHFLAILRAEDVRRAMPLAWVLRADQKSTSQLEGGLGDVLSRHARQGARLERLELYVTTSLEPDLSRSSSVDIRLRRMGRPVSW